MSTEGEAKYPPPLFTLFVGANMAFLKIEPNSSASFGGVEYKSGADGLTEIPNELAGEAESFGEVLVDAPAKDEKPKGKKAA